MEKYAILLGYYKKQMEIIKKLQKQLLKVDLTTHDPRFVFALKAQQLYTAVEDLLKQIAKAFENHIEDLSSSHKGLLLRLNTAFPKIRPAVLSNESFLLLDKMRAFRHFIQYAYDCELEESELEAVKNKLKTHFHHLETDLLTFQKFIESLS